MQYLGRIVILLSTLWTVVQPFSAQAAQIGGGSDGGSTILVEAFRARQKEVIDLATLTANDREMLISGSRIPVEVVPVLIDRRTGKAVPNQDEHPFWADTDRIQIKLEDPKRPELNTFQRALRRGDPVAHWVFHETARASGLVVPSRENRDQMVSIDDTYELSITVYGMDKIKLPSDVILASKLQAARTAGGSLATMDFEALSAKRDDCLYNPNAHRMNAIMGHASAKIIGSMTAAPGLPSTGERTVEAVANASDKLADFLEGGGSGPKSVCAIVETIFQRRLKELEAN